jgi:lipoic acid synthetase
VVLPKFLIKRTPKHENILKIRRLLNDHCLHTVCESAKCPNIGECFSNQTLTFMILGSTCTRNCRFCGISQGNPLPPDPSEPERIVAAVRKLGLEYVVITSVTRDDLPDGGANQFAQVIKAMHASAPLLKIEVLIPDFQGNTKALRAVLGAGPDVLNHNVETVPRLYPAIRPLADYRQSLDLLAAVKREKSDACTEKNRGVYTKSGFMVGLGESGEEVFQVLKDLRAADCDIVTIGQYLPPSRQHVPAERYVEPAEFEEFHKIGKELGFLEVFSGPFVRSSYRAGERIKWK